jgi:hypothetical protein
VDGGDGFVAQADTSCRCLFVAARVEPRVASTVDETIVRRGIAGAMANEDDLTGAGRSSERSLKIDLHPRIIESSRLIRD